MYQPSKEQAAADRAAAYAAGVPHGACHCISHVNNATDMIHMESSGPGNISQMHSVTAHDNLWHMPHDQRQHWVEA
jgi:hypothetical protein